MYEGNIRETFDEQVLIEEALCLLKNTQISSIPKIEFIIEQLSLVNVKPSQRRYSPSLLAMIYKCG